MSPEITVVIPTLAESGRAAHLWEAVDSVLSQSRLRTTVVVVINGNKYDSGLRESIERDERIEAVYDPIGNLPKALATGRRRVRTEFFTFLDDDDRLLPDTLAQRIEILASNPSVDALISNGYRHHVDASALQFGGKDDFRKLIEDPLQALFSGNWLASCGGTYRTSSVDQWFFDDSVQYLEWTYVAFRLAALYRIEFDSSSRFVISDSPNSLSKDSIASVAQLTLWGKVEPLLRRRPDLLERVQERISQSHHSASEYFRKGGDRRQSWKHHALSMLAHPRHGWRYVFFTRYLVADAFSRTPGRYTQ